MYFLKYMLSLTRFSNHSFLASDDLSSADNHCKQFEPRSGQNAGPDLDPNCLTLMVFLKEFFEKVNFEKSQQTATKA